MSHRLTVLYEDSLASGSADFALHALLMRLVEDQVNGETWRLNRAIRAVPRKGVDNVIRDLGRDVFFAGGRPVWVLIDSDRTAEHLGLARRVPAEQVVAQVLARVGRPPEQVQVFFLAPNMEGLIAHFEACAPGLEAVAVDRAVRKKDRVSRDIVLNEAARAVNRSVRDCLRQKQPGLDALAKAIAGQLAPAASLA